MTTTMMPVDDGWGLLRAVQGGDHTAFGALYQRYRDDVSRFVRSILPDRHLAQDVCSETFTRALRASPSVTYRGVDVRAWLFTIARNLIRDHWKSRRHQSEIPVAALWTDIEDPATPEAVVLGNDRAARVRALLELLVPQQRQCLTLRFLRGYTVEQTARSMGRSPAAVRALQYRALRQLADLVPADLT